ncbi:SPFH domain-containing protein [Mycoplasma buteonis]|uniref:SPFH domain-containing protein n=1 Tax=Mycoplasma buteonis TaxID=171280 RepID=UPI000564CE71|nr:SPFH domain-containing protein [Mycoplasma buteonis]
MTTIILASVFGLLGLIILILIFSAIKIVPQTQFWIVQRFGKYHKTLTTGINFIIPIVDRVVIKDTIKEKVFDFPEQLVITKDNATIKVDTVTYLKIVDPKLYAYGAERPIFAIENLTATTLRNVFGELELDQSLTSREVINSKLTRILDEASDAWGIKVNRVEIQNIVPPKEIQEAMIRQMQAERDKRAQILESEGIKQSQILKAEGNRQATILNAEAEKSKIVLAAEAQKEKLILEAQGQKQAIDIINSAKLNSDILSLKAIDKLGELADGKATKIFIPGSIKDFASQIAGASEIFNSVTKTEEK